MAGALGATRTEAVAVALDCEREQVKHAVTQGRRADVVLALQKRVDGLGQRAVSVSGVSEAAGSKR